MSDYTITTWANGYGLWHAKATFTEPIGNTYEALKVLDRAHDALRRAIRKEITERAATHENATPLKGVKLKYEVKEFAQIQSANLATSLTIAERVHND